MSWTNTSRYRIKLQVRRITVASSVWKNLEDGKNETRTPVKQGELLTATIQGRNQEGSHLHEITGKEGRRALCYIEAVK